ncbi:hypothetical protein GQ53DRAFT_432290 [Thozetella sp. PMI_491]|nr:hypothetical protein GQ53DRAFT_432290 [Thozetella sp. PMI_491]
MTWRDARESVRIGVADVCGPFLYTELSLGHGVFFALYLFQYPILGITSLNLRGEFLCLARLNSRGNL